MGKITISNGAYTEEITESKFDKLPDNVKAKFKVIKKETKKKPTPEVDTKETTT